MRVQPVNGESSPARYTGICLYLGRNGKRRTRSALTEGLCQRHASERTIRPTLPLARLAVAVVVLTAFLWPLVADLVGEVSRWLK